MPGSRDSSRPSQDGNQTLHLVNGEWRGERRPPGRRLAFCVHGRYDAVSPQCTVASIGWHVAHAAADVTSAEANVAQRAREIVQPEVNVARAALSVACLPPCVASNGSPFAQRRCHVASNTKNVARIEGYLFRMRSRRCAMAIERCISSMEFYRCVAPVEPTAIETCGVEVACRILPGECCTHRPVRCIRRS